MLWSIESCQNRVSADQYHLTVSRAQVLTHRGRVCIFLKLSADKLLVFKWSHAQVQFFLIHMKYVVFYMCHTIKILISNWPRKLKFSQFLQAFQMLFDFSHQGHTLVALYVQFLCSAWSKFDRWGHAENLCSILKLVYFDSRSWQSFVSTCDVFHGLFPLNVQNEICYQESSVIHG